METKEITQDGGLVFFVSGEIDGTNVDTFEQKINAAAEKTDTLTVDLVDLEYVSSAGLRVFLTMQKKMKQLGHVMSIRNVNSEVMDIFTVTGFVKLLNIE